ncbi:MAG: plasmid recombination protein [Clostridium sp.]|nr:plasmid recombination protein [Clostridium sp.]
MSYCIMRLEKRKANNITGMQIHNDRATENHSNEDINKELSYLNYDLIECPSYKKKINEELEKRYKVNKSLRKDAILGVEVIFTSDKEFFDKLTPEQERLYFEKSLEFLKEFAGEKNIISATVHKDETTPHLHAVFMPLTDDGRLNYKDFINTKYDLINLQDKYHEKMREYFPELERGKSSKETKKKHLSVEDFKLKQLEKDLEKLQKEKKETEIQIQNVEKQIKDFYTVKTIVENIEERKAIFSDSYKLKKDELIELTALATTSEKNRDENKVLRKEKIELEEDLKSTQKEYRKYYTKSKELQTFKDKFEDYSKRLEAVVPEEVLKTIQNENTSYLKIKNLKTLYEVNLYLQELSQKGGYNKLNKVDKEFVYEHHFSNEKARDILLTGAKQRNSKEKNKEKSSEWFKGNSRGRGNGFGMGD